MADHQILAADLGGFGERHCDWEMVGESVLIDCLAHSTEWDRLRVDTWIDHGREFEDLDGGRAASLILAIW